MPRSTESRTPPRPLLTSPASCECRGLIGGLPGEDAFALIMGQAPTQDIAAAVVRELQHMVRLVTLKETFGSWFAVLARSGCLPEGTRREVYGTRILAADGHECLSMAEKEIDDALHRKGIAHRKEVRYPNSSFVCDWVLDLRGRIVFLEYFGLAGQPAYDEKIVAKREALRFAQVEFVEFYAEDLPRTEQRLDEVLRGTGPATSLPSASRSGGRR